MHLIRWTRSRRPWRRIAAVAVVTLAGLALVGCVPAPAHPASVTCTASIGTTGSSAYSYAVEQCHLKYASYKIDTANGYAQQRAADVANVITPSACSSSLSNYHVSLSFLQFVYGGSGVSVAENLYCWYSSTLQCPSSTTGATNAMNAWIKSPGHKANLNNFIGKSVNAGAACVAGRGVYVAVAQFHYP